MKIASLKGREIFDSRGMPTLECELYLEDGRSVLASVPSGASVGSHEAYELRDHNPHRLFGKGVLQSIELIEKAIAPVLCGQAPILLACDEQLRELDGTPDKTRLGANTMLAVSMAVAKAQALTEEIELYELFAYVTGLHQLQVPRPWFNVLNGGAHANNNARIQEFMIIPTAATSFREAYEDGVLFFHELKKVLQAREYSIAVGDEGGFAPHVSDDFEMFMVLIETLCHLNPARYKIALDVAASQFYDPKTKLYQWHDEQLSGADLIDLYVSLVSQLPICALEDGLAQDDWEHWSLLVKTIGKDCMIIGDDIFATNIERITRGISQGAATGVVIKPNQVGTLTETINAVQLSKEHLLVTVASHRSGETEDTLLADLAVGLNTGNIKAGSCCRGERVAKYNRLLRIEEHLAANFIGR
jgi:enolase